MRNFISEDDIEQAILSKLKAEPFCYDIIVCDADPAHKEDLNDGTARTSKKQCVLPYVMETSLKKLNPGIDPEKIKSIVKELSVDYTGRDMTAVNYELYNKVRNNIRITVRKND